jgi:aspartate/methionine/tyrosine aminotransferase
MFARRTNWNLSPNALSAALDEQRASGREVLDLTLSNPTLAGFEYPQELIAMALSDARALRYEPAAKGMPVARQAIARYYAGQGMAVDPERLILTVSTSEAYSYCFRLLCDPGDEVLVPLPSYPLFEFLADIQDVRLVPYELVYDHGWQIEFESLRRGLGARSRAILVVQPNNPTGSYAKPWEVERLNALCREHQLALIADEVFLDYRLEAAEALSFASQAAEGARALTFTLSGLSKISGLPQMKLAWICCGGPEELVADAMGRLEIIADTFLSPSSPVQLAAPTLLEARHGIQRQIGERVRANLAELDRQLARAACASDAEASRSQLSPANASSALCRRLRVEGGWCVVLRVPAVRSDEELVLALLREMGLLAHPGHFYDFPGEGYLVLSLITPERNFAEGVGRLLAFVARSSAGSPANL